MLAPCSLPGAVLEKTEYINNLRVFLYPHAAIRRFFECPHLGFGLQQRGYLAGNFTQWAKPPKGS